ncbi:MAG: hypothetical protein KQ78_02121 [Candidatus Izimaplasma bacterium HR2]|nr:MAG: hypothetical protein KQ78_02121 [Candidatus Izimaplasma bacterium HR2]
MCLTIKDAMGIIGASTDMYKKYKLQCPPQTKQGRYQKDFIKKELNEYLGEINMHGMLIAYLEKHPKEQKEYLKTFDYYKYLKRAEQWTGSLMAT